MGSRKTLGALEDRPVVAPVDSGETPPALATPTPSLPIFSCRTFQNSSCSTMAPPWVPAVGFTLVPSLGGFLGSQYVRGEGLHWYASLQKPAWHPPRWMLGPVWGTLYSAMG